MSSDQPKLSSAYWPDVLQGILSWLGEGLPGGSLCAIVSRHDTFSLVFPNEVVWRSAAPDFLVKDLKRFEIFVKKLSPRELEFLPSGADFGRHLAQIGFLDLEAKDSPVNVWFWLSSAAEIPAGGTAIQCMLPFLESLSKVIRRLFQQFPSEAEAGAFALDRNQYPKDIKTRYAESHKSFEQRYLDMAKLVGAFSFLDFCAHSIRSKARIWVRDRAGDICCLLECINYPDAELPPAAIECPLSIREQKGEGFLYTVDKDLSVVTPSALAVRRDKQKVTSPETLNFLHQLNGSTRRWLDVAFFSTGVQASWIAIDIPDDLPEEAMLKLEERFKGYSVSLSQVADFLQNRRIHRLEELTIDYRHNSFGEIDNICQILGKIDTTEIKTNADLPLGTLIQKLCRENYSLQDFRIMYERMSKNTITCSEFDLSRYFTLAIRDAKLECKFVNFKECLVTGYKPSFNVVLKNIFNNIRDNGEQPITATMRPEKNGVILIISNKISKDSHKRSFDTRDHLGIRQIEFHMREIQRGGFTHRNNGSEFECELCFRQSGLNKPEKSAI